MLHIFLLKDVVVDKIIVIIAIYYYQVKFSFAKYRKGFGVFEASVYCRLLNITMGMAYFPLRTLTYVHGCSMYCTTCMLVCAAAVRL